MLHLYVDLACPRTPSSSLFFTVDSDLSKTLGSIERFHLNTAPECTMCNIRAARSKHWVPNNNSACSINKTFDNNAEDKIRPTYFERHMKERGKST